jgi:hypothetical protein
LKEIFFFTKLTCKKKGRKTDFWSTCHHQDLKVSMMLFPIARNVKTKKKQSKGQPAASTIA